MSQFITIAFSLMLSFAQGEENKPDPLPITPDKDMVPEALVQLGSGSYFSTHAFLMDKATRTLTIWKQDASGLTLVSAVAADFGRNVGSKTTNGDHKTPEGIYFFQESKEGPGLNFDEYGVRAFTLDYPNFFDDLNKKSGNGIWLHAIPDKKTLWRGSRGCVVVRNDIIKQIATHITLKRTPMLIQDNVKYVSKTDAAKRRAEWGTWLETWRKNWESKSLDEYITNYADDFKSMQMDREKWQQYKKNLSEKYNFIKIALTEPVMIHHNNELVLRFLQDYQSDKNADFGEKTLYLRRQDQSPFKIIGEEWRPARRDEVVATH